MSASNPPLTPVSQVQNLNNRIYNLRTQILDYQKLIEKYMVPVANATIEKADKVQHAVETSLDRAANQKKTLEGAAIRMERRGHAKDLLSRFEAQVQELEAWEKKNMDGWPVAKYEALKWNVSPTLITNLEEELVRDCRRYCKELFELLERADEQAATDLKVSVDVVRRVLEEIGATDTVFVDMVLAWSRDTQ
jgi:hypothetical protein